MSFHLNPETGEPGECNAEPGNCPFGGEHFETAGEVRVNYEKKNIDKLLLSLEKNSLSIPGLNTGLLNRLNDNQKRTEDIISRLPSVEDIQSSQTASPAVRDDAQIQSLIALGEEIKSEIKGEVGGETANATGTAGGAVADEDLNLPPEGETIDDVMKEVNNLIGMEGIKQHIKTTGNLLKIQEAREKAGLPTVEVGIHRAFVGGPGTGKTTMARLMGRIYKATGRLSKGHLVEVDREALVAGFVGQTAEKTKALLEKARGGVLFIDEAYSLVPEGSGSDYGHEAIATILKFMEDNRDDFSLIVAGYSKEMDTFLKSNSGLSSRFKEVVDFPDYTAEELDAIMDINLKKNQYSANPTVRQAIKMHISSLVASKTENFGNARTIRGYLEEVVERQADRLSTMPVEKLTKENLQTIELEDLPDNLAKLNH